MSDVTDVVQLILLERQARDRGWWKQMHACYHPDSTVFLSWFNGSGPDFVDGSRALLERGGAWPAHRVAPPVVHLNGDRAVAEVPVEIGVRLMVGSAEVDLKAYVRLLYETERRDGVWKIQNLNAIYERDFLEPVVPGTPVDLDLVLLDSFRKPVRYMYYSLALAGAKPHDGLYGEDIPEEVGALYDRAFEWLGRRPS